MTKTVEEKQEWIEKFDLASPIKAHGEELSSINFSKPTGKDLRELGYPYKMTTDGEVVLNAKVVAAYISQLASIPMSSVDQISLPDLNKIGMQLFGFFFK